VRKKEIDLHKKACQTVVLVVRVIGRRTRDQKVASSTPGRAAIKLTIGQLSLPSLRGRKIEYQPWLGGTRSLCRVAG